MVIQKFGALILAILTIAILVYVFVWGDEGLLSRPAESVEKLKEFIPNVSLGEEVEIVPAIIPEHHADAIIALREAINHTLQNKGKDCFMRYGKLPELGHRKTSIEFIYEEGVTTMFVYSGTDGRQLIPELTTEFKEMVPCVIAGDDSIAENFFTKFIEKEEGVSSDYFNPVNYVKIFYWAGEGWTAGVACDNGNRVMIQKEAGSTGPNYYCNNFEDGGIFFSPDNKHICFIPTNYRDNSDEHGIDEDYVGGTEVKGISVRLGKKELTKC